MYNEYYEYLCDILELNDEERRFYYTLFQMKFFSIIPHDDNRGADGVALREKFTDATGISASMALNFHECNMFEMLVGLCLRLEFETAQSRWEKNPGEWFRILMGNLGIREGMNQVELENRVKALLNRHYRSDGFGGLFPLQNPKKDQRMIEIWWQMNAYVIENYPI